MVVERRRIRKIVDNECCHKEEEKLLAERLDFGIGSHIIHNGSKSHIMDKTIKNVNTVEGLSRRELVKRCTGTLVQKVKRKEFNKRGTQVLPLNE